jgi:hypothetical protein
VVVAAITGYLAIAFLLRMLARTGPLAYAIYCFIVGALALIVLSGTSSTRAFDYFRDRPCSTRAFNPSASCLR